MKSGWALRALDQVEVAETRASRKRRGYSSIEPASAFELDYRIASRVRSYSPYRSCGPSSCFGKWGEPRSVLLTRWKRCVRVVKRPYEHVQLRISTISAVPIQPAE